MREIVPALEELNMNMVTIIRHEVGKSLLLPSLPYAVIAAGALGLASVLFKMSDWMTFFWMVIGFVAVEGGAYWGGWSNQRLVKKYVKTVADEQRKVQAGCAKYKKEHQQE